MFYIKCPKCESIDIREYGTNCVVETDVVIARTDHGYSADTDPETQDAESLDGFVIQCHACEHIIADGIEDLQDKIDNGEIEVYKE